MHALPSLYNTLLQTNPTFLPFNTSNPLSSSSKAFSYAIVSSSIIHIYS